jgi:hypothetical protein
VQLNGIDADFGLDLPTYSRRIPRLRDHEIDAPNDPNEGSAPIGKYSQASTGKAVSK